jgi:hypothetical protein
MAPGAPLVQPVKYFKNYWTYCLTPKTEMQRFIFSQGPSPFIFWCLTDLTSFPHTIPLTLWGFRGWRSYAPTMGYHEPQNG